MRNFSSFHFSIILSGSNDNWKSCSSGYDYSLAILYLFHSVLIIAITLAGTVLPVQTVMVEVLLPLH
jgi:hypothetical protein